MTIEFFSNRHCFPPYENKIGNSCGVFWVDPGTFVIIEKDNDFGFHPNIVTIFWYHGGTSTNRKPKPLWKYVEIGWQIARAKWEQGPNT